MGKTIYVENAKYGYEVGIKDNNKYILTLKNQLTQRRSPAV